MIYIFIPKGSKKRAQSKWERKTSKLIHKCFANELTAIYPDRLKRQQFIESDTEVEVKISKAIEAKL